MILGIFFLVVVGLGAVGGERVFDWIFNVLKTDQTLIGHDAPFAYLLAFPTMKGDFLPMLLDAQGSWTNMFVHLIFFD